MTEFVDVHRFEALLDENAVLSRELAAVQQRSTHQASAQSRRIESQQSEILRLRAQLIGRDTAIAALGDDLRVLEAASSGLRNRVELARECERLLEGQHESQRQLLQAQQEAERWRRRADDLAAELHGRDVPLCVSSRPANVPIYRQLIERTGERLLHQGPGSATG